jgi:DNA polymerase III subunit delta'
MPLLSRIVGQEQALALLRRALEARRLPHALLFAGPEGIGKATCAIALAAALNCESQPGEGCEACVSCQKIGAGLHPDLIHLAPEGASIKIERVRALEERLSFAPNEASTRVVLIDGAERLTDGAANALLKSVEEPRPGTVFVLTSSAPHRVAPTLVSRCQRIRFVPLSTRDVEGILDRRGVPGDERRSRAAALSEGSVARALVWLEGDEGGAGLAARADALLLASRGEGVVELFEAAGEPRERADLLLSLEILRVRLRDLLLSSLGLEGHAIDLEGLGPLRDAALSKGVPRLLGELRAVEEARRSVERNVQPQLALENMILRMREA